MSLRKIDVGNPEVDETSNILDVEVPVEMQSNVSTGNPHIDALCAGDGMTPSTVMLLTGLPGAGKSTLELQLADSITGSGHVALVNACEESLYQVRKTVKRLELKNGFIPSYHSEVHKLIEHAEKVRIANKDKQMFLFVDSLQTLECSTEVGRPLSDQNAAVQATLELAAWAKKNYTIVCLIGQVTKDGTFEGKQKIKHALDVHLHLGIDTDRKSETYGKRVAEVTKNRFGPAGLYMEFEIHSTGLVFAPT
jgi:DNA repair protein RadA/Sms